MGKLLPVQIRSSSGTFTILTYLSPRISHQNPDLLSILLTLLQYLRTTFKAERETRARALYHSNAITMIMIIIIVNYSLTRVSDERRDGSGD